MQTLKTIFTTLCLVLFVATAGAWAQTLHFYMLYDAADTRIGASKDKHNFERFVPEWAEAAGMRVSTTFVTEENFNMGSLNALRVGSNDVVFFVYSGHSHTHDGAPTFLGAEGSLTNVHNLLKRKNARLTITLYDGCNHGTPTVGNSEILEARTPSYNLQMAKLFKYAKGDIRAWSTSVGTYSWGSPEKGGLFAFSFLEAIQTPVDNPSWQSVFQAAKSKTQQLARENNKTQVPRYVLNLSNTNQQSEEPGLSNAPAKPYTVRNGETQQEVFNRLVDDWNGVPGSFRIKMGRWAAGNTVKIVYQKKK